MLTVYGTEDQRMVVEPMITPVGNCGCLDDKQGKPISLEHDQRIEADREPPLH
jgi:hypothetical protein